MNIPNENSFYMSKLSFLANCKFVFITLGLMFLISIIGMAPALAQSDHEQKRAALRNVLEKQLDNAALMNNAKAQATISNLLIQIEQAPSEAFAVFDGADSMLYDLDSMQDALNVQTRSISSMGLDTVRDSNVSAQTVDALTDADYGTKCNHANRYDTEANLAESEAILISEAVLIVAEGVRDMAGIACNQVVVFAGAGGNPANTGCTISTAVYIAAKLTHDGLLANYKRNTFCDATIDSAEIEGTYERVADIYDQITDLDSDLVTHDHNLSTHDADVKAMLQNLQAGIDANSKKLDRILQLLITPTGQRTDFPLM